jgi:hypothetical protein
MAKKEKVPTVVKFALFKYTKSPDERGFLRIVLKENFSFYFCFLPLELLISADSRQYAL